MIFVKNHAKQMKNIDVHRKTGSLKKHVMLHKEICHKNDNVTNPIFQVTILVECIVQKVYDVMVAKKFLNRKGI